MFRSVSGRQERHLAIHQHYSASTGRPCLPVKWLVTGVNVCENVRVFVRCLQFIILRRLAVHVISFSLGFVTRQTSIRVQRE